ncbi:hypothetical protein HDV01_004687 [Terramyces sp. JEL0728]|nr:hypothetical protein HDV01_004687 [Terramyces sp. JEL0728]
MSDNQNDSSSDVVITIPKNATLHLTIQKYLYAYYIFMIVILLTTSSFTLGSRLIYQVSGFHAIEFNGATFDYYFGLFSFSYVMTDSGDDPSNYVYPTEWQTVSYQDACSTIWFSTGLNKGQLIDMSFFCSGKSPWQIP